VLQPRGDAPAGRDVLSRGFRIDPEAAVPAVRPALVLNPNAAANRSDPVGRAALRSAFGRIGETAETRSPSELAALCERWSAEGVDVVAVCGGDGTLAAVVRALAAAWPPGQLPLLLPLHGGTMGVVAHAVHAPTPLAAVAALAQQLASGTPLPSRAIPTLNVGGRTAFTFGTGLFRALTERYLRSGRRGMRGVYRSAARSVASALLGGLADGFRPWRGEVLVDGVPADDWTLRGLFASSVPHGGALRGLGGWPSRPGEFRHVRVHVGVAEALARAPWFAAGVPGALPPGHGGPVACLSLSSPGGFDYVVDGELERSAGAMDIVAGPDLRVVDLGRSGSGWWPWTRWRTEVPTRTFRVERWADPGGHGRTRQRRERT
jgi:hypothetical protein